MKLPTPDHPIALEPTANRVVVTFAGHEIANTTRALTMRESTYPAVHYILREDVHMALLERSTHGSYCPYKGDANYYSLRVEGRSSENAVWTYEAPFDAVSPIKGRLAFYANRVDSIEERAA
jgi:uncharacterized protein (DUF427 family)